MFLLAACSVYDTPSGRGAGGRDGGAGGGTGGSAGAPQSGPWWPYVNERGCQSAGVPSPDDAPTSDDPGEPLPPIYLGLSKYRVSAKDDGVFTMDGKSWADIGFDFDKTCKNSPTCVDDQQSPILDIVCKPHNAVTPGDGNQCRDNVIGKLFTLAAASDSGRLFGVTEADFNCEFRRGGFGVIFKISNYNGQKNDSQVRFDMYVSTGLKDPLVGTSYDCRRKNGQPSIEGALPENWNMHPLWLPESGWKVMSESIAANADPSGNDLPDGWMNDPLAYVRNGYLFARLPDKTEFWFNGRYTATPGFRLVVNRPTLVGELSNATGKWQLRNGTFAGVIDPDQMIRGFRELGFCENMCGGYATLVSYLSSYQDSMLAAVSGPVPDVRCNGLSWAGHIEADQATALAGDIEPPQPIIECPNPRHSGAPPQGQGPCQLDGGATTDGGTRDGGT
jgi:hypothetical protein